MEPLLLVTILAGVLVTKITVEVVAKPFSDNLQAMVSNRFWTLEPDRAVDQELLAVVNAMLPPVEVLEELCSVPMPY